MATKPKAKAKPGGSSNPWALVGKLGTQWKGAQKRVNDAPDWEIDPGVYEAKLSDVVLDVSEAKNLMAVFKFVVSDGESKGKEIRNYFTLKSEDNLLWFQRELTKFGYDVAELTPAELKKVFEELKKKKPKCKLRVKEDKDTDFMRVRMVKVLDEEDGGEEEAEEEVEEEVEEGAGDVAVGSRVTLTFKGKEEAGEVTVLEDDKATVKLDSGKKVKIPVDKLTLEEAAEEEVEEEVEEETAEEEPEEETTEEEAGEEEVPLEVGSKVQFTFKGKKYTSKVEKINEDDAKILVKAGTKKVWKPVADCVLV